MENSLVNRRSRPVAIWLLVGVFMIMVQVLLGGITRLTGSGLSITDWEPIMGAIPPLNHADWLEAFGKYQQTPQYQILNPDFTLRDFKFIFFWEWFHRLWARTLGVVFLIPFVLFWIQKRFTKGMIRPLIVLFLLGGLQGFVGWIMVQSGLVGDNVKVNHLKLAAHFMAAMILLCYTLWFALKLLIKEDTRTVNRSMHRFSMWMVILIAIQLTYGAFMSGLHAALSAHTWPSINGMAIPTGMFRSTSFLENITGNPITVQFIHRGIAYLLFILTIVWFRRARKLPGRQEGLIRFAWIPIAVVSLQIVLGIWTILGSSVQIPVALAVTHQFVGMLFLMTFLIMLYLAGKREAV